MIQKLKLYVVRDECGDEWYCTYINMGASFSKELAEAKVKERLERGGWAEIAEYEIDNNSYCEFDW